MSPIEPYPSPSGWKNGREGGTPVNATDLNGITTHAGAYTDTQVAAAETATAQKVEPTVRASGVADGRSQAFMNAARNLSFAIGTGTTGQANRTQHTATVACADIRLLFGGPHGAEVELQNPLQIQAFVEIPTAVTPIPVSFNGQKIGTLQPGASLLSDPIGVDMAAGTVFYSRSWVTTEFGTPTTLAAEAAIGSSSLSVTAAPPTALAFPFWLSIDTGAKLESVLVKEVTGAGPFTYTLYASTKTTILHANGASCGQQIVGNLQFIGDRNESNVGNFATVVSGTFSAMGASTTVLTAAEAIAGETKIKTTGVCTIPTTGKISVGGTEPEEVTVLNFSGTANPFTWYLAAPLAHNHAAGATVTGQPIGSGFAPTAVVADRTVTAPKPVVIIGDSIPSGQGFTPRGATSFATLALDAASRPYVFLSKGGEQAQTFAVFANSYRRRRLLSLASYGSWVLYEYGTNDIYTGGLTLLQLQEKTETIIAGFQRRGLKTAMTTLLPRTTSTDGFVTTTNQTFSSGAGPEAIRKSYNKWVREGAGGLANVIVDTTAVIDSGLVASEAESGLWRADNAATNGIWTVGDGIHPSMIGHKEMQTVVATALTAMV